MVPLHTPISFRLDLPSGQVRFMVLVENSCGIITSVAPIIVSAIGISAISAKNIGISCRQYYKMYIGNQNLTFLW